MLNPLVSKQLTDMLAVLGQSSCSSVLMQLKSKKLIGEIEVCSLQTLKKNLKALEQAGLITKENFMKEYIYSATEVGIFMQQVIDELEEKKYRIKGAKVIKNTKYNRQQYEELVAMPMAEKAKRLQTTMLKMFRDTMPVLIKEEQAKIGYKILGLVKNIHTVQGSFVRSRKKATIKMSIKTIESNPEIFDEWAKAGCYNPKAIVQYPLAIWTNKDMEEYYEFLKKQW